MKTFKILPILLFVSIFSFNSIKSQTLNLEKDLEYAYKNKSNESLEKIFNEWNKSLSAYYINDNYPNEEIKSVYEVYAEFYKPHDLLKLGDWEWGNELNSKSKYVLIQNRIDFKIYDSDNIEKIAENERTISFKKDSIIDFRPKLNIENSKTLYLLPKYRKELVNFLGTQSTKFGKTNIMSVSRQKKQSAKRYGFIRPYLPILHGHWGGYWEIETSPEVFNIIFNKNLTEAKIFFSVGYQGGETTLIKENDKWIIKESKATWIE